MNAVFMYFEMYYVALVPLIFAIALISLYSIDKILYLTVFFVPLSVSFRRFYYASPVDFSIPTEPLLLGIMGVFIVKFFVEQKFDKRILIHPVSIAILAQLLWITITVIPSTHPLVSFKFLLSRLWFIIAFYFLATQLLKKKENYHLFNWLYIIPLIGVIFYTILRHLSYGIFDHQVAHWVMTPFFKDHTSYGAVLAFLIPTITAFLFSKRYSSVVKIVIAFILIFYFIAIALSFTRAAWVSLFGVAGILIVTLLKIKFRYIAILGGSILILFVFFSTDLFIQMSQNKQESSENFEEHIQSMSNVATDASNLERLNRWSCALRMFAERPVFGWGPGTYAFEYAPFQNSYEKTFISTNAGDLGNAHSEYLGPLAEYGLIGSLTYILIVVYTLITGFKVYNRSTDKEVKILVLAAILSLTTYYLHGFLNNFLDTDKISALFWGATAFIVAMDVYHLKNKQKKSEE